jgi:hypothetical protein
MKIKSLLMVLAALAAAGALLTCENPKTTTFGNEAKLIAVSIGTYELDEIPEIIDSRDWNNDNYSMFSAETGYANFRLERDTKNQRVRSVVSRGAITEWGLGTRSTRPNEFYDTRVPISFESDEYIYFKITSEDGTLTNYYRFFAKVFSYVTHLNTIEIAGRSKSAKTPAKEYQDAEEQQIDIAVSESKGPEIQTFVFDPNSTVKIARAAANETPTFVPPDTPINFNDDDFLYIEVTAENTVDKDYYKFKIRVGHIAEIKELKMINEADAAKTIIVYNKGIFQSDWSKVAPGGFATADLPAAGYKVGFEFEDDQSTAKFLLLETLTANPVPDFANSALTGNVKFSYIDPKLFVLAIKVTAPAGDVLYYAVKADILAANIKLQPKSAWYYADYINFDDPASDKYGFKDFYPQTWPENATPEARAALIAEKKKRQTVAPLTVELDRAGTYTYQWYEADSWYGFYGRHGTALDEKNNISNVNGGPNQYFYLVEADNPQHPFSKLDPTAWKLTGQTSSSYTPQINWVNVPQVGGVANTKAPDKPTPPEVNFVTGSTGECRYYWCVITDTVTNLQVVTERALIITETHPAMEHFIFELTDLPRKKNEAPFRVLRELHKIPLTKGDGGPSIFPEGFDPTKFESMTAHARFFLPDGRAWTQNWTHGDIHMGYTAGSPSFIANESQELVWWQNNLGANSGAIPLHTPHSQKGALSYPPDWIGFAPSGDPTKRVPEANWDPTWPEVPPGTPPPIMGKDISLGSAATNNDYVNKVGELPKGVHASKGTWPAEIAQGWFAGFIELLEVRFTTALPKKAE